MGDKRLSARLVKSAGLLAAHPGQKINASSDSDRTATNAFWRIMVMTLLGRQVPACEPDLMFADHELDFLLRPPILSR